MILFLLQCVDEVKREKQPKIQGFNGIVVTCYHEAA